MYVQEKKKWEVWNHFLARWAMGIGQTVDGMTGPRLQKIRKVIWNERDFWDDAVLQHGLLDTTPEDVILHDSALYLRCEGNFWGMLEQTATELGLLK